jgi:hypothetical protein
MLSTEEFGRRRWAREWQENEPRRLQPQTRVEPQDDFFIWIHRNPLKIPNSTKEKQGKTSFFAWTNLDFLGFICTKLARGLYPRR